jgi:hypothetical protein
MYTVKGQTYMQGKVHEDKIKTGIQCEIFVEVTKLNLLRCRITDNGGAVLRRWTSGFPVWSSQGSSHLYPTPRRCW